MLSYWNEMLENITQDPRNDIITFNVNEKMHKVELIMYNNENNEEEENYGCQKFLFFCGNSDILNPNKIDAFLDNLIQRAKDSKDLIQSYLEDDDEEK